MRPIQRLLLLLRRNETVQSIAIAISVTVTVIGLVVLFLEWPPSEFRASASTNYSTIDYEKVTCLSINSQRVAIEGRIYADPLLAKSMADILSINRILLDAAYSECPWDFFVVVSPGTDFAVFDGVRPAHYTMAIGVCQRTSDGRPNASNCVNKNVYVFNWRVKPHDLFRIGLVGLRPDTNEKEEFKVKAQDE